MVRVVFVCSGNICRSPMAAAFAKDKFERRGIEALIVSCGTLNIQGRPAASQGIAAMREIGIDMTSHYSQGVQPAILDMADWIVVMSPRHEDFLMQRLKHLRPKIVRMWEYATDELAQIDDPVGQDLAAFRACRDLLDVCVDNWIDSIHQESP